MPMGIIPLIIGIIPLIMGIMPLIIGFIMGMLIMGIFIGIVTAALVMLGSVGSWGRFVTEDLQGADVLEQRKMSDALHFGLIDWRLSIR
jgi:hypothetical protein